MAVALSVNLMIGVEPIAIQFKVRTSSGNHVTINSEELKSKPCTRALAAQLGHLYVQGYFQVSGNVEGVKLHGHLGRSSHKKTHAQLKLNVAFH